MTDRDAVKAQNVPNRRFWGLLRRKEAWVLSGRGWVAVLMLLFVSFFLVVVEINPFLSLTERPNPDVLVIEGWVPDYVLLAGWFEFHDGHYSTLLTVGGPFRSSVDLDPDDDYAHLAAYKLKKMVGAGIPVEPVPVPHELRDRTYSSAVAVREWLASKHQTVTSVTVVTMGVHARRSHLLFEKAFGKGVRIGVVSVRDEEYDPKRWWRYSEGVKEIISEGASYLYVRLFFYP
ncbi:MAG TPA: ElyC/SanA/YdcF family protein [Verrucomicrobiae bacterium]|jgi:hypothetical protein|nr:ElyC/SanA/YdcF family protein [Verrucomicrobiae bacterium]